VDIGRRLATDPTLKEASGDAVADRHAGDPGTDLDHFPCAIRQRNEVLAHRHSVSAAHNAEIAEIEGAGLNFHHDLSIGRLGIGSLDFDQRIDAGAAFRQLIGPHAFLSMKLRAAAPGASVELETGVVAIFDYYFSAGQPANARGRTCG